MLAASWVLLGRPYFCVGGLGRRVATGDEGPEETGLRRSCNEDMV